MTLLVLKTWDDFKGQSVTEDEFHIGLLRERGISKHRDIINILDEYKKNETAFRRKNNNLPLCPKCNHPSRCYRLFNYDIIECRWGHRTSGLELDKMGLL